MTHTPGMPPGAVFASSAPRTGVEPPLLVLRRHASVDVVSDVGQASRMRLGVDPQAPLVGFNLESVLTTLRAHGVVVGRHAVDLSVEGRALDNGRTRPTNFGLVRASVLYGLSPTAAAALCRRRDSFARESEEDAVRTLRDETQFLASLGARMWRDVDVPRAEFRTQYLHVVSAMESAGIPVDGPALAGVRRALPQMRAAIVERASGVPELLTPRGVSNQGLASYVEARGLANAWPRTPTGRLSQTSEAFQRMSGQDPSLLAVATAVKLLGGLRLPTVPVDPDGRSRVPLRPFRSLTGRNQPCSPFLFAHPAWMRGILRPAEGRALVYLDWSAQEYGIAAGLSGDPAMLDFYTRGDPYLAFAVRAGAAPEAASRESHHKVREKFKVVALATLYGMQPRGLADRLRVPLYEAEDLLRVHRRVHPQFWQWSDEVVARATLEGRAQSVFGWPFQLSPETSLRTLMNFPIQANGAEMLRVACIDAHRRGVRLLASLHDAILIEADAACIDEACDLAEKCMARASEDVLGTLRLRVDTRFIRWPDRWRAGDGELWHLATELGRGES